MKITRALPIVLGLLLSSSRPATAQPTTVLKVSGSPTMTINTAVPGSQPTAVTDASTTYTVSVKQTDGLQHITAQIGVLPMPANTTLSITMALPSAGGTGFGPVTLSLTPQIVIGNIPKVSGSSGSITYTFSATAAAGVVSGQRFVTFTLVAGA